MSTAPGWTPIAWYEGSAISNTTRRFLMADERGSVVSITDRAGATVHIDRAIR